MKQRGVRGKETEVEMSVRTDKIANVNIYYNRIFKTILERYYSPLPERS